MPAPFDIIIPQPIAGSTTIKAYAYFYFANSTILKDVYLDETLSNVASNPYPVPNNDSIRLWGDGTYHVVIKDTTGNTIYDQNNIYVGQTLTNATLAEAFTAKGDMLVGTAAGTYTVVPVGADGRILLADSGALAGVSWASPTPGLVGAEPALGNPAGNSYILQSDTSGVRSWVPTPPALTDGDKGDITVSSSGAVWTIDNGVITNAKLNADVFSTDREWSGSQRGAVTTDNDLSFDMNAGQNFSCTPTGSGTLTFTNITAGQSGFIKLVNGGNYTISKHSSVKCGSSLLATVSVTGTYLLNYWSDGTDVYVTASGALS